MSERKSLRGHMQFNGVIFKRHQSRHRMTLWFGDLLPEEDWVVLTGGPSWQAVLGARAGAGAGTPAARELSTAAPTPRPLPPARLPGRRCASGGGRRRPAPAAASSALGSAVAMETRRGPRGDTATRPGPSRHLHGPASSGMWASRAAPSECPLRPQPDPPLLPSPSSRPLPSPPPGPPRSASQGGNAGPSRAPSRRGLRVLSCQRPAPLLGSGPLPSLLTSPGLPRKATCQALRRSDGRPDRSE